MSHTNRVSHLLNPRGLATSVHYHIAKPDALSGIQTNPTQSTSALSPLATSSLLGQPFLPGRVNISAIKIAKYPLQETPSALLLGVLPVYMAMPRSRNVRQRFVPETYPQ